MSSLLPKVHGANSHSERFLGQSAKPQYSDAFSARTSAASAEGWPLASGGPAAAQAPSLSWQDTPSPRPARSPAPPSLSGAMREARGAGEAPADPLTAPHWPWAPPADKLPLGGRHSAKGWRGGDVKLEPPQGECSVRRCQSSGCVGGLPIDGGADGCFSGGPTPGIAPFAHSWSVPHLARGSSPFPGSAPPPPAAPPSLLQQQSRGDWASGIVDVTGRPVIAVASLGSPSRSAASARFVGSAPGYGEAGASSIAARVHESSAHGHSSGLGSSSGEGSAGLGRSVELSAGGGRGRVRRGPRPRLFKKHACQADECGEDLSGYSFYYQRNHICPAHLKADAFFVRGLPQRFCQRCGVAHAVAEFHGAKRSCQRALLKHNQRRRSKQAGVGEGEEAPGVPAGGHVSVQGQASPGLQAELRSPASLRLPPQPPASLHLQRQPPAGFRSDALLGLRSSSPPDPDSPRLLARPAPPPAAWEPASSPPVAWPPSLAPSPLLAASFAPQDAPGPSSAPLETQGSVPRVLSLRDVEMDAESCATLFPHPPLGGWGFARLPPGTDGVDLPEEFVVEGLAQGSFSADHLSWLSSEL